MPLPDQTDQRTPAGTTLPTPLTAALGLVVTGVERAKRVPGDVTRLPLTTLTTALLVRDSVRREYDELAVRGQALVSRLRGRADALEDTVTDEVRHNVTSITAAVVGTARETLETAADKVEDVASIVAGDTEGAARNAAEALQSGGALGAAGPVDVPPAPPATFERHDTAATAEVVERVEQIAEQITIPDGDDIAHDELPLPDYDHMTLGSLRGRLRKLTTTQLVTLREYEKAHADRLPVITMLDNRIAKLATDPSQEPAGEIAPDPRTKAREGQKASQKSKQQSLSKGTGAEQSHQPHAMSNETKAAMITS